MDIQSIRFSATAPGSVYDAFREAVKHIGFRNGIGTPSANGQCMKTSRYIPHLTYGDRARLMGYGPHPKTGQQCRIIYVLPNPSKRPEHQWYDVQFDDLSLGRFLERYIVSMESDQRDASSQNPKQSSLR